MAKKTVTSNGVDRYLAYIYEADDDFDLDVKSFVGVAIDKDANNRWVIPSITGPVPLRKVDAIVYISASVDSPVTIHKNGTEHVLTESSYEVYSPEEFAETFEEVAT